MRVNESRKRMKEIYTDFNGNAGHGKNVSRTSGRQQNYFKTTDGHAIATASKVSTAAETSAQYGGRNRPALNSASVY